MGTDGTKWVQRSDFYWSDMGTENGKSHWSDDFYGQGKERASGPSPLGLSRGHEEVGRTEAEGLSVRAGTWPNGEHRSGGFPDFRRGLEIWLLDGWFFNETLSLSKDDLQNRFNELRHIVIWSYGHMMIWQ